MRVNIPGLVNRLPQGSSPSFRAAVENCHRLAEDFARHASAIRGDGKLTADGKRAAMAALIEKDFAAFIKKLRADAVRGRGEIASRRAAIRPDAIDRTDVIGEMQRAELRSLVRGNGMAQSNLPSDPAMVEAIALAPRAASGVSEHVYAEAIQSLARTKFGATALQQINDLEEANQTVEAAISVLEMDMRGEGGLAEVEFERAVSGEPVPRAA